MNQSSHNLMMLASIAIALASTFPVNTVAAQIEGLSPLSSLSDASGHPVVHNKRLEVSLPQQTITVSQWPSFLPQHFASQKISASRQLRPAGPQDRLAFTREREQQPWLVIGDGAGRATELVSGWQLQLNESDWVVTDGKQQKALTSGRHPTLVKSGTDVWCIYLLESSLPAQRAGLAPEAEPHISWAAIRLHPGRHNC